VAVLAGLVTAYGVIMGRYEMIEEPAAFTLLCGGLSGAFLALCLGVWAMVSTWVRVVRGFRYAAGATVLSLALLAVPTSFLAPGLAPPLPDVEGQIEAVARTDILRFADDVVIRVRPHEDGTRFDVRSVSRFGRSDLGRNGARIRQVLDLIELYSEE
jgi:hypothetical protein